MTIYVRWSWKEKTKTFLVIFYFIDDQTSSNLRFRTKVVGSTFIEDVENNPDDRPQPIMSWAPTHVETALLGDVLRYANIIDGLKVVEKEKIRKKLEIQIREKNRYLLDEFSIEDLVKDSPTSTLIALEGADDWFFCAKLNMEYVDFLKNAIAPFI